MESSEQQTMPYPIPNLDSELFWEACAEERLVLQRCSDCSAYNYPPKPACPECGSFDVTWADAEGVGEVYSWVVAHHPVHPLVQDKVPYAVAMVELAEGPRMVSRLLDVDLDAIRAGLPVSVVFESVGDGVKLPHFRPSGDG